LEITCKSPLPVISHRRGAGCKALPFPRAFRWRTLGKPENLTPEAGLRGSKITKKRTRDAYAALLPDLRAWRQSALFYREIAGILNGGGHITRTGAAGNHNQVKRVLSRVGV